MAPGGSILAERTFRAAPDLELLRQWIGHAQTTHDTLTQRIVASYEVILEPARNFPRRAGAVPVTMHWCLAPPLVATSSLGTDGHPTRGGFLPPVPLPRRMWASSEIEFVAPLMTGDAVAAIARIADVALKEGKTGPLCFVTVEHEVSTNRGLAVRERQHIVYREMPSDPAKAPAAPPKADASRGAAHSVRLLADPVLLFRFSAVTFNAHRIHYDRPYATEVEHYDGLVVHGPLQAGLLAEFAADIAEGKPPRRFSFRGLSPLFDGAEFTLNARRTQQGLDLWVENAAGVTTMTAKASWQEA
jgi:3-methylfumaryl-CoA hydratase